MAASPRKFTKRVLSHPDLDTLPPSMPLIIPNDTCYDSSTNQLKQIPGEKRSSLKIVPETLHLLETIGRPVAVVAIGGPCRTGKSYILSRMLGSADDFALGHTMNAQTFGIWVGTTVLDGDEFTVLLTDTEGIDSANAKARDDASILVMTVLLSSYFVYNSLGCPKKTDLQKMSHFAKLATSIAVRNSSATGEGEDESLDLNTYFPDFLWLLRDVILQIPQGQTPTEYLKTTVLKRGRSFTETEADIVSRAILTVFPTVECMTVQPPSADPEVMQDIASRQDSLEPRFNEQVELVISHILQHVQAKIGFVEGKLVDGPLLAEMAVTYLKAVNDPDAIPCINDTWQAAIEARCRKVLEEMIHEYEQELRDRTAAVGFPIEEDSSGGKGSESSSTLFGLHRSILLSKTQSLVKQVRHFLSPSQTSTLNMENLTAELERSAAVFEEVESDLVTEVGGRDIRLKRKTVTGGILLEFAKKNSTESRSQCLALFSQLYARIEEKMKQEDLRYSFEDLEKDLASLQEEYLRRSIGPAKWEVYADKKAFISSQEDTYKRLQGFKKQKFETLQRLDEEKSKSAQKDETLRKLTEQMKEDTELSQKRLETMQEAHQKEMEDIRKQQEQRMENEKKRYEDFMNARMNEMADITKQNKEEMERQHQLLVDHMQSTAQQNSESIRAMNASITAMTKAIANMPKPSGCFTAGTVVTLSDGKKLPIEKQRAGVKILTIGGDFGTISEEYVEHTLPAGEKVFSFNDDEPFAAFHHPFWTTEGWKCLDPELAKEENPSIDFKLLQVGDIVFRVAQTDPLLYEPVKVHRFNFITLSEPTIIYGLHFDGPRSYHANGYIVAANYPVLTKKRVRDGIQKLTEEQKESLQSAITSVQRELTTVLGSWAEDAFIDMGLTTEQ